MIIFTVPHSVCLDKENKNHNCDTLALKAANSMRNYVDGIVLEADINRTICDLNRKECRNQPFREKLRKLIDNEPSRIVDVHSFKKDENLEVYIIDGDDYISYYTKDIVNYLKNNNVIADLKKGIKNDIYVEMREYGFKSFLIEFSESLSDERLDQICKLLKNKLK